MTAQTNIEIKDRFFEALDKIYSLGLGPSKTEFCELYGIDRRNFSKVKKA